MSRSQEIISAPSTLMNVKETRGAVRLNWKSEIIPAVILILLALAAGAVTGYIKADALRSWRYTSDLFSFDTVLQEGTRGHLGMEFTFGNAFGDHAYLYLLLLIPLKFLLSTKTIYVLVLLGPLTYMASAILLFFSTKQPGGTWRALLISLIYLIGFGMTSRGLFEEVYGMHPDTLAGFPAVAMTGLLIWREYRRSQNKNAAPQTIGAVALLIFFLLLKEEMAILGVLFFGVAFLLERSAFHRNLGLLSLLALGIDYLVMNLSKTPFNRTNEVIFSGFLQSIQADGLGYFFANPRASSEQIQTYWWMVGIGLVLFVIALALSKRINPYIAGLFVTGLAKLLLGLIVSDFDLAGWHDFAGLVMITAAILLQISQVNRVKSGYVFSALWILALASVACFWKYDLPYITGQIDASQNRMPEMSLYHKEMTQLMAYVDPLEVVAIPQYSVMRWVGYRYTFYPRGISMSPQGLADWVIYPIEKAEHLAGGYQTMLPLEELEKTSSVVARTPHFLLLKRTAFSESELASRETFYNLWK